MFERTYDAAYIYECLTDPHVWRTTKDDDTPSKDLFFVPVQERFVWIKAGEYGLFLLIKKPVGAYEVHLALKRYALGYAEEICKEAVKWATKNIEGCGHLIARIPSFNHRAMGLAKRVGFGFLGIDKNAFKKDGKYYDMHVYLLVKEVICPAQRQQQEQQLVQ